MLSWQIRTSFSALSSPTYTFSSSRHAVNLKAPTCSIRVQKIPVKNLQFPSPVEATKLNNLEHGVPDDGGGKGDKALSGIQVPRQKYIPISKSDLLDAIVLKFDSQQDVDHFLLLSSCLDSILHAEHKNVLEEMRISYPLTHSAEDKGKINEDTTSLERKFVTKVEEPDMAGDSTTGVGSMERCRKENIEPENSIFSSYGLDLRYLFSSSTNNMKKNSGAESRRGYAAERQKGLLVVEKLDYLQSKLLQGIFFVISKPLGKVGTWINEAFKSAYQTQEIQVWIKRMKLWLEELSLFQQSYSYKEQTSDYLLDVDKLSDSDLPIWLAAQKAVTRYEGLLSPVGPRGRLLRKLLTWSGLIPSTTETTFELQNDNTASELYLGPISLSRITLGDIWRPATRKNCGNDFWKMLKTSISILLSQSILQEPAFEELILLYTEEVSEGESKYKSEVPSLQLKIYERIPIPDLPVVFPHKKLSFRIIDTVRLDVATILGLLAFFINYKFEDILSSPSAILLDVIAVSALIIYVTRVALGYKQTWDRYQLLVNRTLYEKTLASGFGSVHFLLDASEQQQYKEAILAYAILLKAEKGQATCRKSLGDECERFMYNVFKQKVEMPVDKAADTLLRLGLVTETPINGRMGLQAVPCPKACQALKQRWNSLLK
ncbi:uncharacterized protein LOC100254125 isoform X2 [Vitis vinifera]|uniref:uncharacterized protein LOC100254125 isoform X2 n=1 Tax=Vitis vinifera TaxID=29760 RepID=UPI000540116A|nr:uncharacterized protein LOC100254125 isoform X2 [Vitis vinifera]|eukprot:XP_010661543.1 PREDICTED: uncharacterized protein LOC100254125 isoform X2 [Vitis vinifera]